MTAEAGGRPVRRSAWRAHLTDACLLPALLVAVCGPAAAAEVDIRWLRADGSVAAEKVVSTAEFEALPQVTFSTHTTWTTGRPQFTGPSLGDVAALGEGRAVNAHISALDDFSADLPSEDWEKLGAILAVRLDGEFMRVRDKGPFWVMYPVDANPKVLDATRYQGRMVWQVNRIDFRVE